jgi:hypothetical protein
MPFCIGLRILMLAACTLLLAGCNASRPSTKVAAGDQHPPAGKPAIASARPDVDAAADDSENVPEKMW